MRFLNFWLSIALLLGLSVSYAADFGADRHAKAGVQCAACHGAKNEITTPSIEQCRQCHDPAQVAEKTKNIKPQNPHVSPHYKNELDCALCHLQHDKPENYCDQCHKFNFKVK